jgi:hypothetical protein
VWVVLIVQGVMSLGGIGPIAIRLVTPDAKLLRLENFRVLRLASWASGCRKSFLCIVLARADLVIIAWKLVFWMQNVIFLGDCATYCVGMRKWRCNWMNRTGANGGSRVDAPDPEVAAQTSKDRHNVCESQSAKFKGSLPKVI